MDKWYIKAYEFMNTTYDYIKRLEEELSKLKQQNQWIDIKEFPLEAGFYMTCWRGGSKSTPRYFDDFDNSWWIFSSHHDNRLLVPNNAFNLWQLLPLPPDKEN